MAEVKVAFIGGGSYQWGINIARDMLVTKGLDGSELVLMDVNAKAAQDVRRAALKTQKRAKSNWKITTTTSRKRALQNADFVVLCVSVGGFDSMEHDLEVPWKYGVHQTVGDTVGPGGLNRLLRNAPLFAEFIQDIERYCPNAWVLNLTNPMTTLTRTLYASAKESTKIVGLCHEVYGAWSYVTAMLGIHAEDPKFDMQISGINHCIWMVSCTYDGKDIYPQFRKAMKSEKTAWKNFKSRWTGDFQGEFMPQLAVLKKKKKSSKSSKEEDEKKAREAFENTWKHNTVKRHLCNMTGYLPCVGDRHIVEFFGHFTQDVDAISETWKSHVTTIEDRRQGWLPPMKQRTLDIGAGKEKMGLTCSHEPVAPIMDAIANNQTYYLKAGNLPNRGQIPNLPQEAVVETPCMVTAGGVQPVVVGELPHSVAAVVGGHVHRQELAVQAALNADRNLARAALVSDPMVQDEATAEKMLNEMMRKTSEWLPQFYPKKKKRRKSSKKK